MLTTSLGRVEGQVKGNYNCLITRQYDPLGTFAYRMEVYLSTVSGAHMQQHLYPVGCPTQCGVQMGG